MRSDSSRLVDQRLALRLHVVGLQRAFGDTTQACHRRAQIVRDVVEGVLHAANERRDAIEHLVEQRTELVDGITLGTHGHSRVDAPGANDVSHRRDQLTDRLQRRARHDRAASQADRHDDERDDGEHVAKACEQCFAILGALADLEQRAVRQPRRRHLEPRRPRLRQDLLEAAQAAQAADIEVVERVRRAQKERLRLASHHADKQAFLPARSLLDIHRFCERVQSALCVSLRVLAQRGDHELLIALHERRLEQAVGQQDDRQRRDDEDDRVPGSEAQTQPAARLCVRQPPVESRPSACLEDVADAANRMKQLGLEVAIDLLAQARHEHVDDVGAGVEVVAPDVRQDHRLGQHAPWIAHQVLEQRELARAQVDRRARRARLAD